MRSCLILIELLFLLLPCQAVNGLYPSQYGIHNSHSAITTEYNLTIQARGQEITGLCVMNKEADGNIVGTIINEFGVKAFDFTYYNGKAQIMNVIGPLDKWYIRKVLRKDFSFILAHLWQDRNVVSKKRRMTFLPDGNVIVNNDKFKIHYTFSPSTANYPLSSDTHYEADK